MGSATTRTRGIFRASSGNVSVAASTKLSPDQRQVLGSSPAGAWPISLRLRFLPNTDSPTCLVEPGLDS